MGAKIPLENHGFHHPEMSGEKAYGKMVGKWLENVENVENGWKIMFQKNVMCNVKSRIHLVFFHPL